MKVLEESVLGDHSRRDRKRHSAHLEVVVVAFLVSGWLFGQGTVVYPQLALGGGYKTVLVVSNKTNSVWNGSAQLRQGNELSWTGAWRLDTQDRTGTSSFDIRLEPGGTRRYVLEGDELRTGWLRIEGKGCPTSAISRSFFYNFAVNGRLVDSVGVPDSPEGQFFCLPVEKSGPVNTGLALVSPTTSPFQIDFRLLDLSGSVVQERSLSYDGHLARFFAGPGEIFSDVPDPFVGRLEVNSPRSLYVTALRLETTDSGFQLTAVPPDVSDPIGQAAALDPMMPFAGVKTWGPAFTPDGRTCYSFVADETTSRHTIFVSRFERGLWSAPQVAGFSGQTDDLHPCITADGQRLFFVSKRNTGRYSVWVMDRQGDGWGEPRMLGAPVNGSFLNTSVCATADGTLYLTSNRDGVFRAYRSVPVGESYAQPELLEIGLDAYTGVWGVWVNPSENLLIVATKATSDSSIDLYFSTRESGAWNSLRKAGKTINSDDHSELWPRFSPDGRYFIFNRDGPRSGIYRVPVAALTEP